MKGVSWMRNIPWYAWVCGTFVVVVLIAAFTVMGVTHTDTTDLWTFINRFTNVAGALAGTIGGGAAIAAARSSHKAAEQTNGNMKPVVQEAVREVIEPLVKTGDAGTRPVE